MSEAKDEELTPLPITIEGKDREVKLHPLVLINISDHYTREKVRSTDSEIYKESERVAGVLFGVQTGKVVDVLESFEMAYEILDSGVLRFDEQFLASKKSQCKSPGHFPAHQPTTGTLSIDEVHSFVHLTINSCFNLHFLLSRLSPTFFAVVAIFPNYEILGWYTTGATVHMSHLDTHMAMTDLNPNPIMLTLDPNSSDEETLPVKIMETQVTGSGDSVFVELEYKIDTSPIERACVDHISNQKVQTDTSAIAEHSTSLKSALVVMRERIAAIQLYLGEVRKGQRVADPALLRRIASLCHLLPAGSSGDFQAALLNEANDSSLITYLSEMTEIAVAVRNTKTKVMSTFSDSTNNKHIMGGSMDAFGDGYGGFGTGGDGGRKKNRGARRRGHWRSQDGVVNMYTQHKVRSGLVEQAKVGWASVWYRVLGRAMHSSSIQVVRVYTNHAS